MEARAGDSLISAERSRALTAMLWFRLVAVIACRRRRQATALHPR